MLFGLGVSIDSLLTVLGVFQFGPTLFFIPLWLVLLWAAFTTTLFLSLEIVGRSKWIAAICGALAFPFNYAVGERLGAVSFGSSDTSCAGGALCDLGNRASRDVLACREWCQANG